MLLVVSSVSRLDIVSPSEPSATFFQQYSRHSQARGPAYPTNATTFHLPQLQPCNGTMPHTQSDLHHVYPCICAPLDAIPRTLLLHSTTVGILQGVSCWKLQVETPSSRILSNTTGRVLPYWCRMQLRRGLSGFMISAASAV